MEFSDQIKTLRKEKQLTQEAFAAKLGVTRQAVSNWENGKNLPDIEIIIRIASEFFVSLDQLILGGENDMNKMTEKLVEDGSEGRRARRNLASSVIGAGLILLGAVCLIIKANSVEYIDAHGILHENFYLLPAGYACIAAGLLVILITAVASGVKKHRVKS